MFDYNKTYYKVTNERECHNGYQYHDGLNILPDKIEEGFHFTDYENLCNFLEFGVYIREVTIPEDAKVVKNNSGNGWKTNKIILGNKYHIKNDFVKWFDPNKCEWFYEHFDDLDIKYSKNFDEWFNPDKFNWKHSDYLIIYCAKHFDKWWYPDKFNWTYSGLLAKHCSNQFEKWWDPNKFNWGYSRYLAKYCSEHFNKWFDPNTYNWLHFDYLLKYCLNDFLDKWFDYEMLNELVCKMKAKKNAMLDELALKIKAKKNAMYEI